MNDQPTILVKKSDGTSVRMTMDELQAYKKTQQLQTSSVSAPVVAPVAPPVKTEIKPEIKKEENKLEPKPAQVPPAVQQVPQFKKEIKPEIKTEKQEPTKPAPVKFVRPVPPVDEEKKFEDKWEQEDNKSLLDDSLEKEKALAVKPVSSYVLTNTTPVKDIFVDEAKAKAVEDKKKAIDDLLKFDTPPMRPEDLITKKPVVSTYIPPVTQNTQTKQIIQDVKPPQIAKQSVGPVDELENFSLVDFRRLEVNTKAAGLKLIDKFETLKHDSYLLFMDGVKAWYNSPLYRQYQDVLYQSLVHNKTVNEILMEVKGQKDLKLEEFKAILAVNENIG